MRRTFVLCSPIHAQQAGKIARIGYLDPSTSSGSAVLLDAFRQELSKLGWIEGKNIAIEYRFAEQKLERLPELAADLVRLKVDLIVTSGGPTPSAAKKATTSIPIVMTSVADPVGSGLVASLARPGGNLTGVSDLAIELITKKTGDTQRCRSKTITSWTSANRRHPAERSQTRGSSTEAKIGRDRDSTRRQEFGERLYNRNAEAGGRDYDDCW